MQNIKLSHEQYEKYLEEINSAKISISTGNIPKARVCTRRAAGLLVKAWMLQHRKEISHKSSYDVLNSALSSDALSIEVKEIIEHFVLRVDVQYQFPAEIDLLSDLDQLIILLGIELGEE